jgi:outer membrane receptor protein involved in Fe transport
MRCGTPMATPIDRSTNTASNLTNATFCPMSTNKGDGPPGPRTTMRSLHLPFAAPLAATLFLLAHTARAQEEPAAVRLLNSDPQQLLEISQDGRTSNTMTSIVDLENRDAREAPANVQVITARQIQASGARDLMEALELVPGLAFARDADDVIGVALHGLWAEEGRCLFLLDGQQLNENDFGTYGLGLRIPLANVERIEVINGPASVAHGGYAELGVINIVTRTADLGAGSVAHVRSGFSNGAMTATQVSISGAHRLNRDQEISYLTSHGRGHRSNALRLMPDSSLLDFADSTATQSNTFQFNYRWRHLEASMLYMDQTSTVSDAPYSVQQRDIVFGLAYERKLGRKIDVSARLGHADQLPWYYVNTTDPDRLNTNTDDQRTNARAYLGYRPVKWLTVRLGTQLFHQTSTFYQRNGEAVFTLNGKPSLEMNGAALHGELSMASKAGTLGAGYRMAFNSLSGHFQALRLSYTKILGPAHVKLLWNTAFKEPPVMNLNYALPGLSMLQETADGKEAEIGLRLSHGINLTVNAYRTEVLHPAVYLHDEKIGDAYTNRPFTGSEGVDARFGLETKKATVLLAFGLNRPLPQTDLPEMELPEGFEAFQGVPAARGSAVLAYDLVPSLTVRAQATWRDHSWSYQYAGADTLSLVEWPQELIWNAGITVHPKGSNRFAIDLDCRNITDARRSVLSPNTNATTPFALNGREYAVALTYKFVQ